MKIAVIGGGIFGCTAALRLAADRHDVVLFERGGLLDGATRGNHHRLHRGYHYPRHAPTATQCARGYARFVSMFPQCLQPAFPNLYFVAEEGSVTSPDAYLRFLELQGLPAEPVNRVCTTVRGVALGVVADEPAYDVAKLRAELGSRLMAAGVRIRGAHVSGVAKAWGGGFYLGTEDIRDERVDAVVNCTYAAVNDLTSQLVHELPEMQYEYTASAVVSLDLPRVGISIFDGAFPAILPYGAPGQFLLYHVEHSVVARETARRLPPAWRDLTFDRRAWFDRMVEATRTFLPVIESAKLQRVVELPRVVPAHTDATDARPSQVAEPVPGYITVAAGKVNHCLDAADEVAVRLLRHEGMAA